METMTEEVKLYYLSLSEKLASSDKDFKEAILQKIKDGPAANQTYRPVVRKVN